MYNEIILFELLLYFEINVFKHNQKLHLHFKCIDFIMCLDLYKILSLKFILV